MESFPFLPQETGKEEGKVLQLHLTLLSLVLLFATVVQHILPDKGESQWRLKFR
jgi:hypothetical protein